MTKLSQRDESVEGPLSGDQFHYIRSNGDSPETFSSYRGTLDDLMAFGAGPGNSAPGQWTFNNTTTEPPGAGQIRLDNATQASATKMWISETTAPGVDAGNALKYNLEVGRRIYVQNKDNATQWQLYEITGTPVDDGTYWDVPVTFVEGGSSLPSGQRTALVVLMPPVTSAPYDIPLSFAGTPDAGALMGKLIAVRDIEFAANFSGSAGHVGTNPDATFDIDVQDDGASIGTISISTGGAFTFTTTSGTAKTVASGSRIEFYAPSDSPAEDAVSNIAATLKGTT